jgi:AcrR family transcriptional regulator
MYSAMSVRAEQKERTRRALVDAALRQISAERGFSSLTLREVAREAGIAPTSFYRHFQNLEELGLTLVDEAGLKLRRLMRQARQHYAADGGVLKASVQTFMEYFNENSNLFYLLSRERAVGSPLFRRAIRREMDSFIDELASDLELESRERQRPMKDVPLVAEAMVTIVFNEGLEALTLPVPQQTDLAERMVQQLRMVALGAEALAQRETQLASDD